MIIRKMIHDALRYPGVKGVHTLTGFYPSACSVEHEKDGQRVVEGACLRQQYYSHSGVPRPDMPDDVMVKLEMGNWVHEMLVEMVKRAGYWAGDETRMFLPGPPPVSGRADLFVKDPRDGSIVGCEIKSISGYYGVKMCIKGPDARPKDDHVLQCMPYLEFYGKSGLTKWILLYIDRDSGAMAEYMVMLEDDGSANVQGENFAEIMPHINLKSIKERWLRLQNALIDGRLPERDYTNQYSNKEILRMHKAGELNKTDTATVDRKLKSGKTDGPLLKKGDWRCNYCDYVDKCWSNNPELTDGDTTEVVTAVAQSPEAKAKAAATGKKAVVDKLDGGEVF